MTIQREDSGYTPEVKPEDTFLSKLSDRLDAGDEVLADDSDGDDEEDFEDEEPVEEDDSDEDLTTDDTDDEDEESDDDLDDEEAVEDDEPDEAAVKEPKLSPKAENRFQKLANENRDLKALLEQQAAAQAEANRIQQQQFALQQAAFEQARQQQLQVQQAEQMEAYQQQLAEGGFRQDSWEHQNLYKQATALQTMQAKLQAMEQQAQAQEAQRFQQEYQSNLSNQIEQALQGRAASAEQKQHLVDRAYEHAYLHQMQTGRLLSAEEVLSKSIGAVIDLFPKAQQTKSVPKKKVSDRALRGAAVRGGSSTSRSKSKSSKSRAQTTEPESPEMGAIRAFMKRNGRKKG